MNKTLLLTTAYLDNPIYKDKTIKFVDYYKKHFNDIHILDNGGREDHKIEGTTIRTLTPHYTRESHLSYKYLWRAVYFYQHYFHMGYDRIVYMDNDAYLLSDKAFTWANNFNGWGSPFCKKHNFPETGIQIITPCDKYNNFVSGLTENEFITKYNLLCMETTLPVEVNKDLVGDRYSEYGILAPDNADFSTQVEL